jgi:hypothetical protein
MSAEINQPAYFAILTAEVRYCKKIEQGAKLLYAEITALSNMHGYCWASNKYFQDLYDVDERTIRRWLESLKKEKFLWVEIEKQGMTTKRKIWIKENSTTGQKCPGRGVKNVPVEGAKMPPIIIHSPNNTIDDDDAGERDKETDIPKTESTQGDVDYKDSKGKIQRITTSEIFHHLINSHYPSDVIRAAIVRIRLIKTPITDFMEYFKKICESIILQNTIKSEDNEKKQPVEEKFNLSEWIYEWKTYEELMKSGEMTLENVTTRIKENGYFNEWTIWRQAL